MNMPYEINHEEKTIYFGRGCGNMSQMVNYDRDMENWAQMASAIDYTPEDYQEIAKLKAEQEAGDGELFIDDEKLWELVYDGYDLNTSEVIEDLAKEIESIWEEEIATKELKAVKENYLTAGQAASEFNIATTTVTRACEGRWIPALKIDDRTWLIRRVDAEARWGKK